MTRMVALGELMPPTKSSLDPRKAPEQLFELFSIPAFDAGDPEVIPGADIGSSKQILQPADVLLSKIVPHIRRAWVVEPNSTHQAVGSTEWIVFRGDRFDPAYLRQALLSDRFHQAFMHTVAGVGGSLLRARPSYVAEIEIPLPPIEEQRRIAAVLDAADELRTKRRQALAKLDTLTQAIFIDMFGDLANNDRGWLVAKVGDFVDRFESGKSIAAGPDDEPGGFRVLKVSAVTSKKYKAFESKPVPIDYQPPEAHHVRKGDLLMSRANTTELVGACAYVETTPARHLLPDKLWRFVWRDPDAVESLYIWRALQDRDVRQQVEDSATGSSGSMKNISQQKFMSVELPFPPVAVQRSFGDAVRRLQELDTTGSTSLSELDTLFASLQQRAFAGEL